MESMEKKIVAVVGVSERKEKFGYRIFVDMIAAGWNVVGVNVRGGEVEGKKIYKSLTETGVKPDTVVMVVPPAVTEKIVDECVQLGVGQIWMQPGSESDAAIEKAKKAGIAVTAHACIMVKQGLW